MVLTVQLRALLPSCAPGSKNVKCHIFRRSPSSISEFRTRRFASLPSLFLFHSYSFKIRDLAISGVVSLHGDRLCFPTTSQLLTFLSQSGRSFLNNMHRVFQRLWSPPLSRFAASLTIYSPLFTVFFSPARHCLRTKMTLYHGQSTAPRCDSPYSIAKSKIPIKFRA